MRMPLTIPERRVFGRMKPLPPAAGTQRQIRGDVVTRTAASPGQARVVARLVHGPKEFGRLGRGEILVAHATMPAWAPLFALSGGLVTDLGGARSHGSTVPREYGIPAVLGTGNATERIPDGQTITVNGTEGGVYLAGR
jgi:phosphoenolpyruvate synthase/pyruvate phosphate dikinase